MKMKPNFPPLLLLLFFLLFNTTTPSSITDFVYAGCSPLKYTPGTPYQASVNSLLTSIANSAIILPYNQFTSTGPMPSSAPSSFGLYQCRGDLSVSDCQSCIQSSLTQIGSLCPFAVGASLQLLGCFIRYDNSSFVGTQDKGLVLKRCGGSVANNGGGDYGAQREGVLTGITCGDCLGDAVGTLRSACGDAVSGEVYMVKCYARYWATQAYARSGPHDYSPSSDVASKTWAIVLGLIAGVALIIVFLSFLRQACCSHDEGNIMEHDYLQMDIIHVNWGKWLDLIRHSWGEMSWDRVGILRGPLGGVSHRLAH
ncbi:Cysteine-rich repeat secretory protein 12 [Acorus calamus]|uniref:Cysteine-rich repeat secretory protein 12 n=1 Tax=Acorus calamus TaxID=4465 RepID=A0AAV9DML9_ACOCL|nr:Cysteine-rich repeat secretory protein 12 [Acorus calamus]